MKKPSKAQQESSASTGWTDGGFVKAYPHIAEYLITEKWEDGTKRVPSALSISVNDGMTQLALNDKDLKQSMYSTAGSLAEALQGLEGALKDGSGQWRAWKSGKGR